MSTHALDAVDGVDKMVKRAVPDEGRRRAVNSKITNDVRSALEKAAAASGRTLSLEIETRLQSSFDMEADLALQDEVKAEMRGTIAALEQRIADLERYIDVTRQTNQLLWPDESARILGQGFSMALASARHASGQDWREDQSAPLIVAGAVRRLMDRCTRIGGSIMAEMFDRERIASTAESIAETVGPYLDKNMPALAEREFEVANWTGRAFMAVEFRDVATGAVLETTTGPEWDVSDPEQRPKLGDDYRAAITRFKPDREKIDIETFTVHILKDGTHKRISSDFTPAGPGPQPTPEAAAPPKPARGRKIKA